MNTHQEILDHFLCCYFCGNEFEANAETVATFEHTFCYCGICHHWAGTSNNEDTVRSYPVLNKKIEKTLNWQLYFESMIASGSPKLLLQSLSTKGVEKFWRILKTRISY